MSRMRRLFATVLLTLVGLVTPMLPAQAASTATNQAATWLAAQTVKPSQAADVLLGLAAADDASLQPAIDTLLATAKSGADAATDPGAAAKLALVAEAYGLDPHAFGGVDLIARINAGQNADGSYGSFGSAFGSGLVLAALNRAGAPIPDAAVSYLVGQQSADGSFGFGSGPDPDITGMAMVGLAAAGSAAGAPAALAKAKAWALANETNGSWAASYDQITSSAIVAVGLNAAGESTSATASWIASQQLANGALPYAGAANLLTTAQSLLALGQTSYLTVTWTPKAGSAPKPSVSASATASAAATATVPAPGKTPAPVVTGKVPELTGQAAANGQAPASVLPGQHTKRGIPAPTGVEDESPAPSAATIVAVLLFMTLGIHA